MADEVKLYGVEAAQADIAKWSDQLQGVLVQQLQPFGHQMADILHGTEPVLTGRLAGSAELMPGNVDTFFGLALGRQVIYAGWVEFGGTRGRPYVPEGRTVWPVARANQPQFLRLVEEFTKQSIEHYSWTQE